MLEKDIYKGWTIRYDPPPIPARSLDWIAVHDDYDGWTDNGEWVSNNLCIHAASREEIVAEIDEWEIDQ